MRQGWRLVAVLLLAAGCGSIGPSGVDPLSVQRPGYPVNGLAMGDPAALVSEPGSPDPVRYRGSAVVQACDLLTPEDLTAAGLLLVPGTATGLVSRTYFDGHGSTELPLPPGAGGVGSVAGEVNRCHYVVGVDPHTATVTVAVHQPAYVAQADLDLNLKYGYRKSGDIGSVEVFGPNRPLGEYATPWLRHGDVWVQLTLGPFPESLTAQLVDLITRRAPANDSPRDSFDDALAETVNGS